LTTWHCILSAELTKTHSFKLFFFGDFAHWVKEFNLGKKPPNPPIIVSAKTFPLM